MGVQSCLLLLVSIKIIFLLQFQGSAKLYSRSYLHRELYSNKHRNLSTESSAIDDKNDAHHPEEDFEYWNIPRDINELSDFLEDVTQHSLSSKRSYKRCYGSNKYYDDHQ